MSSTAILPPPPPTLLQDPEGWGARSRRAGRARAAGWASERGSARVRRQPLEGLFRRTSHLDGLDLTRPSRCRRARRPASVGRPRPRVAGSSAGRPRESAATEGWTRWTVVGAGPGHRPTSPPQGAGGRAGDARQPPRPPGLPRLRGERGPRNLGARRKGAPRDSRSTSPVGRRLRQWSLLRAPPPPRAARPLPCGWSVARHARAPTGLPVLRASSLLFTCRRHYPGGTPG